LKQLESPMPKQVSALNTFWLFQYINENHPEIDVSEIIQNLNNPPQFVENLKTGRIEPVSLRHLMNVDYWFSNQFMIKLYDLIQEKISDVNIAYKMGRTSYKTQQFLKIAIGIPLIGTRNVLKRSVKESIKYTRTKEFILKKNDKNHAIVKLVHNKDIITNNFAMEWHRGVFEAYANLAGATEVQIIKKQLKVDAQDKNDSGDIWEFEIKYKDTPFLKRLFQIILFNIPMVKKAIEQADEIQLEHKEQILNRDRIIKEKTDTLKKNQKKILLIEKKNTELKLRSLSADLTNTEERERRSIAEDLHDSVSQTLGLSVIKLKNIIDSDEYGKAELIETKDYIEQAVDSIRSLTFQLSPPVLHDFGLEAAIEWLVTDIRNRYDLNLIFSNCLENGLVIDETNKINLFRSIRELTLNIIKHAQARNAKISLFLINNEPFLKIEDDGIGFDSDRIFKRKMKSYGLYSVKERLEILGSTFKINSNIGSGTIILISITTLTIKE
jgi:signal transduction histidine kinase